MMCLSAFRLGLFLVYTLPAPDSVSESSVMCAHDLLTGAFFHLQITFHASQMLDVLTWSYLSHQFRVPI